MGSAYFATSTKQSLRKLPPTYASSFSSKVQSPFGVHVPRKKAAKVGDGFRSIDKTVFTASPVQQKTELARVSSNINSRFRVSLEPLDTKQLIKGMTRETETHKWMSKKDFNTISTVVSHRRS